MENQVEPSTNPTVPLKSKKNPYKVVSFFVIGLLLAVAGAGVYYYLTQKPGAAETVSDTPPALKISTLQGKSVETGYLVFSSEDESKNQDDLAYSSFPKGINLFYSDADIKVSEIIDKIKANNGQRVLVAYYDTGVKNFYTYPVGPYQGTVLMTENTVIPRFQGFFIMSDRTLELLESGVKPSNEFAGSYDFTLASDETGWMMAVVPESAKTSAGFNTFFKTNTGRIQKVYLQADQNKFDKVADLNSVAVGNYSLVWLLVGPATQAAATSTATTQTTTTTTQTTTTTAPAVVCGDGTKADTEACDDGNTSASDGCSATCTVEPDVCTNIEGSQYSLPAAYTQQGTLCVKCGDGNKEGTELCDDGNIVADDGCSATCTVEIVREIAPIQQIAPVQILLNFCGDGSKTGTEGCDDGNTVAGDGCSATCTVEIAPIRPIQMSTTLFNTTTDNTIVPEVTVSYMDRTYGGTGVLASFQDEIYTPNTPASNDPVWCMKVDYKGNKDTWIELSEIKFTDKIKLVNDEGGDDKWSQLQFRTRELVYFWIMDGATTTTKQVAVAILNFPYRSTLYRLIKANDTSPATVMNLVASKPQSPEIAPESEVPLFTDENIDNISSRIKAGETGYFCLIHDTNNYIEGHPDDPSWIEGGAVMENVKFKDSIGNIFSKTGGNLTFTNSPSHTTTIQIR